MKIVDFFSFHEKKSLSISAFSLLSAVIADATSKMIFRMEKSLFIQTRKRFLFSIFFFAVLSEREK